MHIGAERQSDNKASVSTPTAEPNELQGQRYSEEKACAAVMLPAIKRTFILCFTTKSPRARPHQYLFAPLHIFHPRAAPQQAPCSTEGRHLCYYLICATGPFNPRPQVIMGYVVCLHNATKNKIKSPLFVCCFLIACAV